MINGGDNLFLRLKKVFEHSVIWVFHPKAEDFGKILDVDSERHSDVSQNIIGDLNTSPSDH